MPYWGIVNTTEMCCSLLSVVADDDDEDNDNAGQRRLNNNNNKNVNAWCAGAHSASVFWDDRTKERSYGLLGVNVLCCCCCCRSSWAPAQRLDIKTILVAEKKTGGYFFAIFCCSPCLVLLLLLVSWLASSYGLWDLCCVPFFCFRCRFMLKFWVHSFFFQAFVPLRFFVADFVKKPMEVMWLLLCFFLFL